MTPRRWLAVLVVAGLAIFALSFVNAWIVHDREVRGEGYRFVQHFVSAWRGVGMPVLTVGVLAALAVALGAAASLLRPFRVPPWALLIGSAFTFGVIVSAAWPVGQSGHASSVALSSGFLLPAGVFLAAAMVVAAIAVARPPAPMAAAAVAIAVVALAAGAGGRWLGLEIDEGTGRHWSEGSYTRAAVDGEPTETMTIRDEAVTIGDRWSGSWEWSGWTIVIADDPACPDARGTYHAHGEGDEDLRFVMVVDPCQDGARAADLQTGIWERVP